MDWKLLGREEVLLVFRCGTGGELPSSLCWEEPLTPKPRNRSSEGKTNCWGVQFHRWDLFSQTRKPSPGGNDLESTVPKGRGPQHPASHPEPCGWCAGCSRGRRNGFALRGPQALSVGLTCRRSEVDSVFIQGWAEVGLQLFVWELIIQA